MSYYIDPNGTIHSGPSPAGCTACEEGDPTFATALQMQAAKDRLESAIQTQLSKIDTTRKITLDKALAWPAAWGTYTQAVRAATALPLPTPPTTFPDGTAVPAGW